MPSDTFTLQIFDTGISIPATHATTHLTGNADAIPTAVASVAGVGGSSGLMSALQAQQLVTNNGKVTNASHTGDVTGSTELTIDTGKVTADKLASNSVTTAKILNASVNGDKLAANAVTYAKLQTIPANTILGNSTTGETTVSSNACSALGFTFLASADVETARGNLGLGSMARQASTAVTITGGTIDNVTLTGSTVSVSSPSGILPTANGGTGRSTYTAGDIIYASGVSTLSTLPKGADNLVLHGSGGGSLPAWGLINLATDVSSVLPTTSGGTGLDTITGYVKGTGTSALSTSETIPVADISGVLPIANGGTGQLLSVRGQISKMDSFAVVDVVSLNVYLPVANSGTLSAAVNMTVGSASTFSLKNTSGTTRMFRVYASVDATAANNDVLGIKLYSGTGGTLSVIPETECRAFTSNVSAAAKLVTSWIIELSNSQEIAIYVANHTGTGDITIQRARLIAEAII